MALAKKYIDVDFTVDPRPLTEKERSAISEFIRVDKEKYKQKNVRKNCNIKNPDKNVPAG